MSWVVQCDGAALPHLDSSVDSSTLRVVNSFGESPNLSLNAQNLSATVLRAVGSRAADLVRIAAYAYAADQVITRGGDADGYGRKWKRPILMCIPVAEPVFWAQEPVKQALIDVLEFLTDDSWRFEFSLSRLVHRQTPFEVNDQDLLGKPDSVVLLSGGADSICTAVQAVSEGKRPVIVSHSPAANLDARQNRLVNELQRLLPRWTFPRLRFMVHRVGSEAADKSQRSRAFLFASLGAAVASELGISGVLLGDNGIVSLNLPISGQLLGAMASRATHPKFLHRFNILSNRVLPGAPQVTNPLWSLTRAETLEILKENDCQALLQETVSCSRSRGRSNATPHCGVCSQCVDRRFGAIAAGLEDHDLPERYGVDFFREALPDGESTTVAQSYVRFAKIVASSTDEGLFRDYPQLYDCIVPSLLPDHQLADSLCSMLKRHASSTLHVLDLMIQRSSSELRERRVAPGSLIGLEIGLDSGLRSGNSRDGFPAQGANRSEADEGKEVGTIYPVPLFYSYSHKDERHRVRLETHLTPLRRQGIISEWHDRMIGAGEEWKGAIDEHLESSRIILLLVSHNFIASDYCYDVEMKRALEKHKEHSAIVIPIILSPVDLHGQIFGKLQSLPRDRKPISGWNPRDEGWRNVAVGIREAIERLGTAGD